MSLSKLLSSGALKRFSPLAADLAHNPQALKALDKQLLHSAKQSGPVSKFMPAYTKYMAKPASSAGTAFYGGKMDNAKILATLGGTIGGIRYGGEAARPMYNYISNIASKINPEAMKAYAEVSPESVANIMKPGMAITSAPLMSLDSALGGALHLAEHPILSSVALPFAAYGALKGGSALLSRLGRGRRIAQLSKGIAPKAYLQQAQQLGFK